MSRFKIQLLVLSFYYLNWGIGYVTILAQVHSSALKLIYQSTCTPEHYHTHVLPRRDHQDVTVVHCDLSLKHPVCTGKLGHLTSPIIPSLADHMFLSMEL